MSCYAYYNGRFGIKGDIDIPLSDRSIFFGDAVYDAAIGKYDRIMWESEHIDRLLKSAEIIGIKHSYTKKYLSSLLREIAIKSMLESYLIYVQISRKADTRRHSAYNCDASLLVTVEPFCITKASNPLSLVCTEDKRYGYCNIKTVNLLPAVLSATLAEEQGCDEAIFIKSGIVTECTKSNISIIKQGRLVTHPLDSSILPGITRGHLIQKCVSMGIAVEEREFTREEMMTSDEILITSATKLCKYASKVDGYAVGGGAVELRNALCSTLYDDYLAICVE